MSTLSNISAINLVSLTMKARNALLCTLALTISAMGCASSSHDCTDFLVLDSVIFSLNSPLEARGEYAISVTADGKTFGCTATIAEGMSSDCGSELRLNGRASGQPPAITAIVLVVQDAPDAASLVISKDGATVAQTAVEPDYVEYEPTGPGCGRKRKASVLVEN